MSDQPSNAEAPSSVKAASKYNLSSLLGDLGSLPFLLLTGLMAHAHFNGPGLQSASVLGLYAPYVFIAYSAVILSFLSGALWERSRLEEANRLATTAILFSNLIALCAWACLLLIYVAPIMTVFAVCLLMAGFLSLLWVERLTAADIIGTSYWSMRLRITLTVVFLHGLVAALMLAEFTI
ncbi:hypothetical protein GB2207_10336 [marine gamma proteobacterium HTCC2207]|jgi:hypothetical protein|uniref:DUF3429 domain-containing protein n=1 Tax=gamma proteobacterium HTCC2207 TaxID=314287 RepID=Q1YU56_9GAMM|nr:hypothetical protein GB2207_10336 [marine gamma proteobacterium HTCC2207] [gamma proteobacterium HTCC2207]MBT5106527.1 DUF3429 domain-containing protein [Porticoccaceae bacterium]MBT6115910.1 DUF3429 domain-containing protein [Porticoccaceae bacterium]MBT6593377.1 DUF3429 domain-containing protein [Porticoccaceae bacterium]MDB4426878.1 DUF3429 domain-containing protein [Porticoccaceae bacterium]